MRLLVLDAESGEVTPLPDPPGTGGAAEIRFTPCIDDEGEAFGLLDWDGTAPAAVEEAGWAAAATPQGDGTGAYLVLGVRDDRWEPLAHEGAATSWSGVVGCGPGGIWGGRPGAGAVVSHRDGTAAIGPLPAPPRDGDVEISLYGSKGDGTAIAVVQGPPDDEPDRPRDADAFILDGADWRPVPTVAIGPSSYPFLDGGRIASLVVVEEVEQIVVGDAVGEDHEQSGGWAAEQVAVAEVAVLADDDSTFGIGSAGDVGVGGAICPLERRLPPVEPAGVEAASVELVIWTRTGKPPC